MTRIISALLILAMLLSFAACGSKKSEGTIDPVLPTPSPSISPETIPEPEETPEPAPAISITIENTSGARNLDGFDVATYSYDYPVIEISDDADGDFSEILDWAEAVKAESDEIVENVCAEAEDAYNHAAHWFTNAYFYTNTLELITVSDSISVIKSDNNTFMGSNHPLHGIYAWVIDTKNGAILEMNDFSDSELLINALASHIIGQIEAEQMQSYLFPDYEDGVLAGIYDGFWYPTEEGIVVMYAEYGIAPYSEGSFEFTVAYEQLGDLIDTSLITE